jgi:carboxyl-terminal processing protease
LTAFDRAGLFLVTSGARGAQHVMVRRVVKGSPAAEAGIVAGDEVTSLDGRDASALRLSAIRSSLKASLTHPVRLGIRRDGASAVRVLQLRDLLL